MTDGALPVVAALAGLAVLAAGLTAGSGGRRTEQVDDNAEPTLPPASPVSGTLFTPAEARAALGPMPGRLSWEDAWKVSDTSSGVPLDVARNMQAVGDDLAVIDDAAGPVTVSSWYRPGSTLGSGSTLRPSRHATGQAVDFRLGGGVGGLAGAVRASEALRRDGRQWGRIIGYDGPRSVPARPSGTEGHIHLADADPDGSRPSLVLHAREGRQDYTRV